MSDKKCVFNLDENIASLVSYAGFFVTGIIFLVMEKENKTVRFHALQSIIWFIALGIVSTVAGWIPIIGGLLAGAVGLLTLASCVYLMYTAYQGQTFKIPVIGDICWQQINK